MSYHNELVTALAPYVQSRAHIEIAFRNHDFDRSFSFSNQADADKETCQEDFPGLIPAVNPHIRAAIDALGQDGEPVEDLDVLVAVMGTMEYAIADYVYPQLLAEMKKKRPNKRRVLDLGTMMMPWQMDDLKRDGIDEEAVSKLEDSIIDFFDAEEDE